MIKKIVLVFIFLIGLIYLVAPGPSSVSDFPALPNSIKSNEPGDTIQVPNIAAYFSNHRRAAVTSYYRKNFSYLKIFGITIPPIRLNRPPEESYAYIRDQQISTYLEEYVYPLRDSLFVNGFEPFDAQGKPYKRGATDIYFNDTFFDSKTSIRYYGSSILWRVGIYLGVWVGLYFTFRTMKGVLKNKPWD